MLGAIAGDIIGSPYGRHNTSRRDFPLFVPESTFTDDSVLTVATMEVLLTGGDYAEGYRRYFAAYPGRGYGPGFARWAATPAHGPYWSQGNGSAMRVSPVGWCYADLDRVLAEAVRSAEVTHNHPDGLMGAQAIAGAVFLARTGHAKEEIRRFIETRVGYPLWQTIANLQRHYPGGGTCADTVPPAITAFLESTTWEDAVRLAVSIGGDSDTLACMAGAVAEAYYGGVPAEVVQEVRRRLATPLQAVVDRFAAAVSVRQTCLPLPA